MTGSVTEPALVFAALLAAIAVIVAVGFRLSRSHRDLGSDADRATYATLHTAALASEHLRPGLTKAGASKACRHLRGLLQCDILVLTDHTAVLGWDGARSIPPAVMELALQVVESGQTRLFRAPDTTEAGIAGELAIAPILVEHRVAGTVVAFAAPVKAGLVRAVNEVAAWVATQIELAELDASRTLLAEAEVRALRAQISPHFIYNSLNAIASFINTDPPRARDLVLEFADFTRYSFRKHGDFTTLAEELKSIDRYLTLERARFGERLSVSLQISPEVLSTVIPFLSLQPLVENAVRHGLESREGVGHLSITARDDGAYAEVTIEDDGVGMDPERLRSVLAGHADGDHVGLRNVDVRLRQLYGERHGLVIDTAVGAGTLITMRVPKSRTGRSL
jgi:two-component system LytT family sensor kinase